MTTKADTSTVQHHSMRSDQPLFFNNVEWIAGDVVQLRSGGVKMTIGQVLFHPETPAASVFFPTNEGLQLATVPLAALKHVVGPTHTEFDPSLAKEGDEVWLLGQFRHLDQDGDVEVEVRDFVGDTMEITVRRRDIRVVAS